MDLIAGVMRAAVAIHAAFAVFFLAARVRRREPEYGALALLCGAIALVSAARTAESHAASAAELLAMARLACVVLIVSFAVLLHFALEYARVEAKKVWLVLSYSAATGYELLNARGLLHEVSALAPTAPPDTLHVAPMSALGVSLYLVGLVASGASLALFARAYLGGRREAIALVVGSTVLFAALVNDAAYAAGLLATTYLATVGYLGIVAGGASTCISRWATSASDSSRRGAELRIKSRELRRALSELAAAQEELGRKEQLAVVGELAAVIAHEVRNPLAIIGNAVAGLRKPTLSRDDQTTLLSILDEETTRLNRLVSDLLRYARPVNLQRQRLSIRELLERGLQLVKNQSALQVELKIDAPDLRIWGDGNLLRQVFENLIDNACQAMHYGGLLTVRLRSMHYEGADGLAVDIIDTGEGMDTIVRSRARDPFFTTRPSGTGLGLAIVDRIVDAHGGHFLIESRSGEGTTVTVFLPSGSPSEPPPPRSRGAQPARRGAGVERTPRAADVSTSPSVRPPKTTAEGEAE